MKLFPAKTLNFDTCKKSAKWMVLSAHTFLVAFLLLHHTTTLAVCSLGCCYVSLLKVSLSLSESTRIMSADDPAETMIVGISLPQSQGTFRFMQIPLANVAWRQCNTLCATYLCMLHVRPRSSPTHHVSLTDKLTLSPFTHFYHHHCYQPTPRSCCTLRDRMASITSRPLCRTSRITPAPTWLRWKANGGTRVWWERYSHHPPPLPP
jgi:hypothetical protein